MALNFWRIHLKVPNLSTFNINLCNNEAIRISAKKFYESQLSSTRSNLRQRQFGFKKFLETLTEITAGALG